MAITFGEWVRWKRGEEGEPGFITQQELADRLGVNRTRVVQIEKLQKIPKYETRQRVHEALGTNDDELRALGILKEATLRGVTAATGSARGTVESVPRVPSVQDGDRPTYDTSPFEKGTWHWVVIERLRQMDDDQAEDVADYADYILTRKKSELPVIVRASSARDRVAP